MTIVIASPNARGQESELCRRIQAEFKEMPGLNLNVRQAARLFDIDPRECEHVLELLTQAGKLSRRGDCFVTANYGWFSM